MLSILVCSVNSVYLSNLRINLNKTIGLPYELLVWDNVCNPKPITEVYNLLAAQAQYPYWCFIHEDIRFDTDQWGGILLESFAKNPDTGLIGVAGARYKSKTPSGWSTGMPETDLCNIYHQDKNGQTLHIYMNPGGSAFEPVVNIDGVFIAIRREVWQTVRFDDQHLNGFHLYDIDFSLRVLKHWKAAVVFNIDIMHFTQGGNFGDDWVKYTLLWHKLHAHQLPCVAENCKLLADAEKKIRIFWFRRLSIENISIQNKFKWIIQSKAWVDPACWPYAGLFMAGPRLKRRKPVVQAS